MMRLTGYALVAVVLLTAYGTQVCPFLDSLPLWRLAANISGALALVLLARPLWMRRFVAQAPVEHRVRRQMTGDFLAFTGMGLALTFYDLVVHGFPVQSGMKLFVGVLLLGVFASLDMGLLAERVLVEDAASHGKDLTPAFHMRSMTRGFAAAATVVLALLGGVFFLIIVKDLDWMVTLQPDQMLAAKRSIMLEVSFVVLTLLGLMFNLVGTYAGNLRVFFDNQTRVLGRVARGHLDGYVPVAGANEFAVIARHTNEMIDGLKEKQRIESLFGKVVSPEIARRLLEDPNGGTMGGARKNLVILFSDVRNFTTFSETQSPEQVVHLLNAYFAVMVRIIRSHGGLVDKFIGDGMLAVFGLDNPDGASSRAVQASVEMLAAAKKLTVELAAPVEIGIGIHRGDVVAGKVGSPERLEFTFIGDTVNTASRLESATKALAAPLVVSDVIKGDLRGEAAMLPWVDLGPQQLKGKAAAVPIFGLRAL